MTTRNFRSAGTAHGRTNICATITTGGCTMYIQYEASASHDTSGLGREQNRENIPISPSDIAHA